MTLIACTTTEDAQRYYARFFAGLQGTPGSTTTAGSVWDPRLKSVKWGEGGWEDPGTGRRPRVPSPSLRRLSSPLIQDLDAVVDTTRGGGDVRYGSAERAVFSKNLAGGDITIAGNSTMVVRAFLDFGEFNDDGFGNDPVIWELGVYSDHPTVAGQSLLVAYATFQGVPKNSGNQIERYLRISFGAT